MTPETKEIIIIIKYLLNGNSTSPKAGEQHIDYDKLYNIAKQNSVANTIASYIIKCDDVPEPIKAKFKQHYFAIIAQQVKCEQVIEEISGVLNENNLKGIILKGSILKELYPDSSMRSMSDIDVYMEEDDIESIHDIMINHGFQEGTIGRGNHYEYMKYQVAKIEFHPELVALDSAYGQMVYKRSAPISEAMDLWNHVEQFRGSENLLQLTSEYHYVYVVMHMLNHFLTAGTGIRSVIDIWIMNRHYGDIWNRGRIDSLLEEFNVLKFERYARALACKWFGDISNNIDREQCDRGVIDNSTLSAFEDYILSSGTYGTLDHSIASKIDSSAPERSKLRILVKSFFQPYGVMKNMYPVLKKMPILLPFMWIYRTVDIFKNRGAYAKYKMNAILKADNGRAEEQEKLFASVI